MTKIHTKQTPVNWIAALATGCLVLVGVLLAIRLGQSLGYQVGVGRTVGVILGLVVFVLLYFVGRVGARRFLD